MKVVLVTDGACRGNNLPRNEEKHVHAAFAYAIFDEQGTKLATRAERVVVATNNEAEYIALLHGLFACKELGATEVEHVTDSQLVAHQTSGEWQVSAANIMTFLKQIQEVERQFQRVTHTWKPREDSQIVFVDALGNAALDG